MSIFVKMHIHLAWSILAHGKGPGYEAMGLGPYGEAKPEEYIYWQKSGWRKNLSPEHVHRAPGPKQLRLEKPQGPPGHDVPYSVAALKSFAHSTTNSCYTCTVAQMKKISVSNIFFASNQNYY